MRAIEHGLKVGARGLPLIGSGDWNDGLNMVGNEGRGESVWRAFFLYDALTQFAELARAREDAAFADRGLAEAKRLQETSRPTPGAANGIVGFAIRLTDKTDMAACGFDEGWEWER